MDEEAFRKELQDRQAAHGGDFTAAVDDVLSQVLQDLDKSVTSNWQEIAEADALLGLGVSGKLGRTVG